MPYSNTVLTVPNFLSCYFLVQYIKNLAKDYKSSIVDAVKDCRSNPIRATIYASLAAGVVFAAASNPTIESYEEELVRLQCSIGLLSARIRNRVTTERVEYLSRLRGTGRLRRVNLVLCSVLLAEPSAQQVASFASTSPLARPTLRERLAAGDLLDVGVCGRWLYISDYWRDYDVNADEWPAEPAPAPNRLLSFGFS